MFFVIVILFFFTVNWIASYAMAILPIHFLAFLGSLLQLFLLIIVLILFTWFFGD